MVLVRSLGRTAASFANNITIIFAVIGGLIALVYDTNAHSSIHNLRRENHRFSLAHVSNGLNVCCNLQNNTPKNCTSTHPERQRKNVLCQTSALNRSNFEIQVYTCFAWHFQPNDSLLLLRLMPIKYIMRTLIATMRCRQIIQIGMSFFLFCFYCFCFRFRFHPFSVSRPLFSPSDFKSELGLMQSQPVLLYYVK